MAKLDRKDVKIFAENSKETLITEFRTEDSEGNTASFSRDPDIIQNENYSQGWVNDTNNLNTKIYGEDLNAVNYVLSYLLKYLYENGIAEWKSTTTYYTNSIARVDDVLYISLIDDNTGNDPTSTVGCWRAVVLDTITSTIAGAGSDIVKGITGNQITFKSISVDGYASLTDNGDQLNIHVLGGGGVVDAFWGQIQGTLSNQTDLVNALGAKQDTITVNAPLSIDVDNEISIAKATTLASGYLDVDDFNTFNGKQDALTGLTHTYDSDDDEVTIEPSASNSNIGTDLAPITNINGLHLKAWNIFHNYSNIQMAYNNEDDVNFELGTSDDTSSGSYYFNINDDNKFRITSNSIIPKADILPPDNTYDLGSSTRTFAEGYIKTIKANEISPITTALTNMLTVNKFYFAHTPASGYDIVDIYASILSTGSNKAYLGRSRAFDEVYTKSLSLNGTSYTSIPAAANNGSYAIKMNGSTKGTVYADGTGSNTIDLGTVITSTSDCAKLSANNTLTGTNKLGSVTISAGNISRDDGAIYLSASGELRLVSDTQVRIRCSATGAGTSGNFRYYGKITAGKSGDENPVSTYPSSDIRLKKDIEETTINGIETINKINIKEFRYKTEDEKHYKHIGVIAQEIEELTPEVKDVVLHGEDDEKDMLAVEYGMFTPYLIKAVQELSAKVEKLEARIKELENDGRK